MSAVCINNADFREVTVFPPDIGSTCKSHHHQSCVPAFGPARSEIVLVTLNNNKRVDDLFLIYFSFSHLIDVHAGVFSM